jgi:hypothetical protein
MVFVVLHQNYKNFVKNWIKILIVQKKLYQKKHVAANFLKLFFRELPESLLTNTIYKQFLNAIQLTDTDNQRVTLLKTFELLNTDNRQILFYLFDYLIYVIQYLLIC